jgi:hypothetical protein
MREFFGGWRRKVGCVMLVMACVVTISWVRSRIRDESAFVRFYRSAIFFHHENGRFLVWRDVMVNEGLPFGWEPGSNIDASHASTKTKAKWVFNSRKVAGQHWMLVVPLTLLSAYLILWKPRKRAITKLR